MYVFYNIQHFIMLSKLQLLETIVCEGEVIVTSELRLSYYSGPKQLEVIRLIEKGHVKLHEHPSDLYGFIRQYSDYFPHAGDGILILIHLCLTSGCTMVIEDDQAMVLDIASFFSVPTISVKEFFKQKIRNQQYHDFLIEYLNK